uniref:Uncharacterized protein n=1 Tax=Arundo donax TaxID=35708 RepID=A0A0A9BRW8_ARUDO
MVNSESFSFPDTGEVYEPLIPGIKYLTLVSLYQEVKLGEVQPKTVLASAKQTARNR